MDLNGRKLAILEDEYLIRLELERIVLECGAASVHATSTVDELARWLNEGHPCDLAIAELTARGQSALPLILRVRALGIPVICTTAYEVDAAMIIAMQGVPVVTKPYGKAQILRAAASLG
ncbi:hypothetical protein M8997_009825 [Phyllobacterium sp. 21LDTY02-6]|uniref:hypothetical protein n=1 Tax=Phyllobacterium sp. 21LDTY02-6 TaxID=2944903 RepID=UPI002020B619|nr:hypothetical protein [Phyllobacterium sp. 21LDTY02-6]MCO4317481.1 hypothetical protein [Phyllobacterium sp. 21LDTY02-6]